MNQKIIVVGTSGAGKSTLARALSKKFNIPHIEMDHLYWGKDWSVNPDFRERLEQQLQIPQWIICGNYLKVIKNITSIQANIIIWLDYPFYLVFWRALKRGIKHIYTGEKVCGDNTETLRRLLSKDSILWWVIKTYVRRKRTYQSLMSQNNGPMMIRIKSPKELDKKIFIIREMCSK